ncbi:sensor histidine kinase [Plantactinospora soyae]|uniref:Two-component system sensor histidine kinase DesK n=1 Tax=Plantactinospora soyae TaxID=1544732 RepID=A0A927MCG8_9ACTN|nr:histidine kinase [Plantactinospora soyae]MBE1490601.1 two-component system sensor histidine kinase DesK [Plantactinospora soyae]
MRDVIGWWRACSQPERFDLFTRATLYLVSASEPVTLFNAIDSRVSPVGGAVVLLLSLGHTVLCLLAVRAGVEHYLGRRDRPVRLLLAAAGMTLTVIVACLLANGPGSLPADPDSWTLRVAVVVSCYFLAVLCTVATPRYALAGAAGMAGVLLIVGLIDAASPEVLVSAVATFFFGFFVLLFGFRSSLWMLGVLWELDRSRGNQVRLAVAEERLRFARDLHDVLGRNLSVVALKSELAAQLAKRDRPRAVEEMLEVRRIAQDSLAEVREVVRGYRSADLDAELAGARSVLASAGVRCRVLGEGHELSPQAQSALGWVVREGTTNVLRHSEAISCTVSLRRGGAATDPVPGDLPDGDSGLGHVPTIHPDERLVTLVMENDGVRPGDPPQFGNGLLGLSERLAPLGGRVTVERRGRDRFRLTAELPVVPPVAQPRTGRTDGPSSESTGQPDFPLSTVDAIATAAAPPAGAAGADVGPARDTGSWVGTRGGEPA